MKPIYKCYRLKINSSNFQIPNKYSDAGQVLAQLIELSDYFEHEMSIYMENNPGYRLTPINDLCRELEVIDSERKNKEKRKKYSIKNILFFPFIFILMLLIISYYTVNNFVSNKFNKLK